MPEPEKGVVVPGTAGASAKDSSRVQETSRTARTRDVEPNGRPRVLIGIAGGTGSGKTTVAEAIGDQLCGNHIALISQDNYYLDQGHLPFEERIRINYDHPDAFDWDLLLEHLRMLRQGRPIERPVYDFAAHSRKPETVVVRPSRVVVLEGIMALVDARVREIMDIKIFVDTDADVRFIRRLTRDLRERGRSLDSIVDQYQSIVRLMHMEFIEPSKRHADIIVPEGGFNRVAVDLIVTKIRSILNEHE